MDAIVDLIRSVIRSYPSMFSNIVVDILYLIVLVLVAGQYRKIQSVEKNLYGAAKNKALNNTVYAVGLGLIGGLLSSLLLVLVGVSAVSYTHLIWYVGKTEENDSKYAGSMLSLVSSAIFSKRAEGIRISGLSQYKGIVFGWGSGDPKEAS